MILNGHTGNNALIDLTLREIKRDRGVIIPWLNIWPMVPASLRQQAWRERGASQWAWLRAHRICV